MNWGLSRISEIRLSDFPSIDHDQLLRLLARRFKGPAFLALLERIVNSYQAAPGKGLPIGSLTSQHFANAYLAGADRFLLDHPKITGHVRYMDDILFWAADKGTLQDVLKSLRAYLGDIWQLRLKADAQINRSVRGVTYCGYRILPGTIRLTPRKQRRYRQLTSACEHAWHAGHIGDLALQQAYAAAHAITLHADSLGWRRIHQGLHPSGYA